MINGGGHTDRVINGNSDHLVVCGAILAFFSVGICGYRGASYGPATCRDEMGHFPAILSF